MRGCSFKTQRRYYNTITKAFQEVLVESGRTPNKMRVDKGNEFYSRSMK